MTRSIPRAVALCALILFSLAGCGGPGEVRSEFANLFGAYRAVQDQSPKDPVAEAFARTQLCNFAEDTRKDANYGLAATKVTLLYYAAVAARTCWAEDMLVYFNDAESACSTPGDAIKDECALLKYNTALAGFEGAQRERSDLERRETETRQEDKVDELGELIKNNLTELISAARRIGNTTSEIRDGVPASVQADFDETRVKMYCQMTYSRALFVGIYGLDHPEFRDADRKITEVANDPRVIGQSAVAASGC